MCSIIEACKFLASFYCGPLNISVGLLTHISISTMNHFILVHYSGQVNWDFMSTCTVVFARDSNHKMKLLHTHKSLPNY